MASRLRWLCPFCDYSTGTEQGNYDTASWQHARQMIENLCNDHLDFHVEEMVAEFHGE